MAENPGHRVTVGELASFYKISRNHLVKVVHKLGLKGFVSSIRGKGGGLYLAKPAEQISVGNVVRQMEGHFHLVDCFNAERVCSCRLHPNCVLTAVLGNALEQFLLVLDATALSDVLPGNRIGLPSQPVVNHLNLNTILKNSSALSISSGN